MAEIPEEYKELISTLQKMKLKPKAENPKELEEWIKGFAMEKLEVKQEATEVSADKPSTTASSSTHFPPKLNTFSGNKDKKKGDASYELWRFEVEGLIKDGTHSPQAIIQAIRRSLKGEAGLSVVHLGPDATLTEIMNKMESVYGNIDEVETIMSDFYNARQLEDEDVSTWSCRLEGIIDRAITAKKINRHQSDSMLHDMLWKGLRPTLKDISHFEKQRFDTFDGLRRALRRIEKDHQLDHPPKLHATSKQAVKTDETETSELTGVLKQMNQRLEKLETQHTNRYSYQQQPGLTRQPYSSQQLGFTRQPYSSQQSDSKRQPYQQQQQHYNTYGGRGRGFNTGRYRGRGNNHGYRGGYYSQQQGQPSNIFTYPENITCNRCHREGHIAKGCRFNKDVNGTDLN